MKVVAYDPCIDESHPEITELGIRMVLLDMMLAAADVLSVHLPNTEYTRNLLDADELALLPRGAYVINVGRGEVFDEEALADAITSGWIGSAGFDVRPSEQPVRGRLEVLSKVILTPHVAGITDQAQDRIARILSEEMEAVLSGVASTYAVGAHSCPRSVGSR